MKIVVDNKIPYIREALAGISDQVVYLPGSEFTPETIHDADALIVRTRTHCNRQLLQGSQVRFIATATIGFDHIDTAYCREAGIAWQNAPGCNSASVEQYMESVLLLVARHLQCSLSSLTLGVVGVGHVGSRVARMAEEHGMRVLRNDPPLEASGAQGTFYPLETLARECDLITFHVPLTREGRFPTYHLADHTFLQTLQKHPILINTSRGSVIDNTALLQALQEGTVRQAILDVWENEPAINLQLLDRVLLGTPHIAGYSADGKANATRMALDALCAHFQIQADYTITPPEPAGGLSVQASDEPEALLQIYDPRIDSQALKQHPEQFESLRGNYRVRREKTAYHLEISGQESH